jgi:hypothetical protein
MENFGYSASVYSTPSNNYNTVYQREKQTFNNNGTPGNTSGGGGGGGGGGSGAASNTVIVANVRFR